MNLFIYFCIMNFSSKLLEDAVNEFSKLPGVGQKTALRLVLHLLNKEQEEVNQFGNTFIKLKQQIKHCSTCHNISDYAVCEICTSHKRDKETICVVEDTRDVMAIENTGQYFGVYHVLGGLISPMDGIGPSDLFIEGLVARMAAGGIKEVILALSPNMEGDTTLFYLYKRLKEFNVPITTIARGIAFGGELEYTDEITLGRSIITRVPYETAMMK
jgi:recombination protein RecR